MLVYILLLVYGLSECPAFYYRDVPLFTSLNPELRKAGPLGYFHFLLEKSDNFIFVHIHFDFQSVKGGHH